MPLATFFEPSDRQLPGPDHPSLESLRPSAEDLAAMVGVFSRGASLELRREQLVREIDFDSEAEDEDEGSPAVELRPIATARDAAEALRLAEELRRLAFAITIRTLEEVTQSNVAHEHGHVSAKAMCGAVNHLAGGDVYGLEQVRNMTRRCDQIAEACYTGELSEQHLRLLARVYANPRVRSDFMDEQDWFLRKAKQRSFRRFHIAVARWVQQHDLDGAEPNIGHEQRDATTTQDLFTNAFQRHSTQGPLVGAQMEEIDRAYTEAEFTRDWEAAKAIHGDKVCKALLARSDAQRRADAQAQIYADAINNPNRSTGFTTTHVVVWDQQTFTEVSRRYAGAKPQPLDLDTMRCETLDGRQLDPSEAFIDALTNGVRRVVLNAKSVVIDMSEKRFFTGLARTALQISRHECEWPGCHIPPTQCQADHTIPHARGGPTTQANGSLLCKRHNRHKERGYTVWRDENGKIRIVTPSGDEITAPPPQHVRR